MRIGRVARVSGGVMSERASSKTLAITSSSGGSSTLTSASAWRSRIAPSSLGHPRPLDLDVGEGALAADHLAEPPQVVRRRSSNWSLTSFDSLNRLDDARERAVVDQRAVVDHQHAVAERLDVAHVVAASSSMVTPRWV